MRPKLLSYLIDMDSSNFDVLRINPVIATLPKETQDLRDSVMLIAEVTVPSPTLVVGDILQIPR